MARAKKLRELFKKKETIWVAGAHDGLSAKLVEKNGFDAAWASGFEIAASFAVPDANILTMSQNLERSCEINDAVSIPVIADCDTGFGNSNNVIHMVKKYEAAGIAAVCIEDKLFPKVNSFISGRQELASLAEFVGKIMAAKNSQSSSDFMVIARVEALIAGHPVAEAIIRADAYIKAGADAILIHSKEKTQEQIVDFCRAWKKRAPVVIVPTKYPDFTEKQMNELGIKVVIYANQGIRAAARAMDEALGQINSQKTKDKLENKIASMDFMFALQEMDRMKKEEEVYLKTGKENISAVILGAGKPSYQKDLMELLNDIPPLMLDIKGKTLLQRNADILQGIGLKNISVVTGYGNDKVDAKGVKKIFNPDYEKGYILESLMKARKYLTDRVLVCYGDIMFDRHLIESLISRQEDIVLAVDPSFKNASRGSHVLELVRAKERPLTAIRTIGSKSNPVAEISSKMDKPSADYEFVGIAYFSKKGFNKLCQEYDAAKKKYAAKKFNSAESFQRASLADLLNEMAKNGCYIDTLEVRSGWIELHTFENYKLACLACGEAGNG